MAKYNHCPHCGNTNEGDDILRCETCNRIHCDECSHKALGGFGWGDGCPDCGGSRETLGTIEADDTSPNEDDEFTECPNCGNTEDGVAILECTSCGLKHCDACSDNDFGGLVSSCPTTDCCGTRRTIGHVSRIEEEEAADSDDDEDSQDADD